MATLEMLAEIGTFVLFLALFPLVVNCVRSAERMPPGQGGIAGWLRGYVAMELLGLPAGIPRIAAQLVQGGYGMAGLIAGTLGAIAFLVPVVIAPLIKRPAGRTVTICGLYAHAAVALLPINTAGPNEIYWMRFGYCLGWAAYFLRSKRVKATYRPNPTKPL